MALEMPIPLQSKASTLHQLGWQLSAIALVLNVSERDVQQWLKQRPEPNPSDHQGFVLHQRSNLSRENDIYRLANLLKRPPSDYGFLGEVWTYADIRSLIEQAFGVSIPMAALERILRKIDWQKQQQKQQQVYQLQWWELRRQGWSVQAIASKYAVAPDKVESIFSASTAQIHSGRLSKRRTSVWAKLTEEQMRQLPELLLKPPSAYGLAGEVWTQKKIVPLIEQVYQVSFSPSYISYLLKRIRDKLRVDMTHQTR